jgi:hypothetical protein
VHVQGGQLIKDKLRDCVHVFVDSVVMLHLQKVALMHLHCISPVAACLRRL